VRQLVGFCLIVMGQRHQGGFAVVAAGVDVGMGGEDLDQGLFVERRRGGQIGVVPEVRVVAVEGARRDQGPHHLNMAAISRGDDRGNVAAALVLRRATMDRRAGGDQGEHRRVRPGDRRPGQHGAARFAVEVESLGAQGVQGLVVAHDKAVGGGGVDRGLKLGHRRGHADHGADIVMDDLAPSADLERHHIKRRVGNRPHISGRQRPEVGGAKVFQQALNRLGRNAKTVISAHQHISSAVEQVRPIAADFHAVDRAESQAFASLQPDAHGRQRPRRDWPMARGFWRPCPPADDCGRHLVARARRLGWRERPAGRPGRDARAQRNEKGRTGSEDIPQAHDVSFTGDHGG
jgi:hypothetical protein